MTDLKRFSIELKVMRYPITLRNKTARNYTYSLVGSEERWETFLLRGKGLLVAPEARYQLSATRRMRMTILASMQNPSYPLGHSTACACFSALSSLDADVNVADQVAFHCLRTRRRVPRGRSWLWSGCSMPCSNAPTKTDMFWQMWS